MYKKLLIILITFFVGSSNLFAVDDTVLHLEKKTIPSFESPEVPTYVFPNGLKLYYYPNEQLPVFEIQVLVDIGAIHENADKLGLLTLLTASIRTGGTENFGPDEVDEKLEEIASNIEVGASRETSSFKASCLTKDVDLTLKILFEMIKSPRLATDRMELVRTQMLDAITHRNEEPAGIAQREFAQMLYGENDEGVRIYNADTLRSITVEEMRKFMHDYFTPDRMRVAVSSQIPMTEVIERINKAMGSFALVGKPKPVVTPVEKTWTKKLEVIDLPVNQSNIIMGHFGEKRFNPDKYALILGNYVMGGSTFGSRLGSRIRSTLGLAYSIYTQFEFDTDFGMFALETSTKTESTVKLISESKATIKNMIEHDPATQGEIDFARNSILNQLVFQLDDPFKIAVTDMQYDYYGYPKHYLRMYQDEIAKVTVSDVNRVLKQYIRPDDFEVLIVGNKAAISGLDALGEVTVRPLDDQ